jgi:(p)ppGpp synthase/HD superfamily hydrolase
MLTARFDDALVYASDLHRAQVRKGASVPYVSHLMAVAAIVLEQGGDEDQAIAGLLHDAVEDQGGEPTFREIRARFGDGVAQIVADCTDAWGEPKPPWRERKEIYIAHLPSTSPRSLLVSLADKTHNAQSVLRDYDVLGDALWDRFKGGKAGTLWYYRTLSRVFDELLPGPLATELHKTVAALPGA